MTVFRILSWENFLTDLKEIYFTTWCLFLFFWFFTFVNLLELIIVFLCVKQLIELILYYKFHPINNSLLLINRNLKWPKSNKLPLPSYKKAKRKPLNNKVNNESNLDKPSAHKTCQATFSQSVTSLLHGTILSSTSLILQEDKLSQELQEVWKSSLTEINLRHMLPWWLQLMSSTDSNNWVSQPFISSSEPEVEQETRPQDQALNQLWEPLPEMESRLEESKT